MKYVITYLFFIFMAPIGGAAEDPEFYAEVKQGEKYQFEKDFTRSEAGLTRLMVTIKGVAEDQRPPGSPAYRKVRFVAKCGLGTMALAGITLYDQQRRITKVMVVPPGGSEFAAPIGGTPPNEWLEQACNPD